jgi:hypothetical protein
MLRVMIALCITLAVPLLATSFASAEQRQSPGLLSPKQARALINAPASNGSSAAQRISTQQVQQAASEVGAVVEVGTSRATTAAKAQKSTCWFGSVWTQWGLYPYQQRVTDNTYWCTRTGGVLTWRVTHVTMSSTLCSSDRSDNYKLQGGNGSKMVVTRSTGYFACQTIIPWVTVHTTRWEDAYRDGQPSQKIVQRS